MKKQVAYLAGPMRGYAEYNFPAFHAAAAKLRGHGLDVWSPAEHDVNQDGFDPAKDTAQPMRHYMKRDLPAVLAADMVCVLPGWEKSQGAQLEVHVARTCGIPVYWADTMQPVAVSETEPTFRYKFLDRAALEAFMVSEGWARPTETQRWVVTPEQHASDRLEAAKELLKVAQLKTSDVYLQARIHNFLTGDK